MSATALAPSASNDLAEPKAVTVGSPVYNALLEFLYREARALDQLRYDEWATTLAEDLSYSAPIRQTRVGTDRKNSINRTMFHFDDDYLSIMGRIGRLGSKSAWAEDPPSRTRRLITNVLVDETDKPDEYAVDSYILLMRSRYEYTGYQMMSAVRHDLIRRVDGAFKLARREIVVDQSVLGMSNFAVFF